MNCCIIIPHYKHDQLFARFLPKLLTLDLPCIVVDDGSDPDTQARLSDLLAAYPQVHLFQHHTNRGKGAAVITACYHARAMGFSHVLQLDADGQHNIDDATQLLDYAKVHPHTIVCGRPFFDESAPKVRVYGRKVTDFWVAFESLSFQIKDGLCGFRIYPLQAMETVIDNYYIGPRMDFDPEILVKAAWANIDMHFIPTKVIYHADPVSHFNYLRDNLQMIRLHVRLIAGMLIRLPKLLYQRFKAVTS
ncbi:glycosyltransferase family 2 protein [Alteromonas flava]|uniref:glycosyltransferase family 2 protein n=1 Tax=Alteromonas flava TaxID=2048003 RepID=UPI000C2910BA|nr:glycosyltransferase family 2 protein [Alteromonas flava]